MSRIELDAEIERLINKEYAHHACDQDCPYNAKGIALLGRLRDLRDEANWYERNPEGTYNDRQQAIACGEGDL